MVLGKFYSLKTFHSFINRMESTDGRTPIFKGSSGMKMISSLELRSIKVDIHRNISGATDAKSELQREIVNPEEVILKRREGNVIFFIFTFKYRSSIRKIAAKDGGLNNKKESALFFNLKFSFENEIQH